MFGSTGLRLACCTIRPVRIYDEIDDFTWGRLLDAEVDLGEDLVTHDEFRELFGFTPAPQKDILSLFDEN